MVHSPHHGVSHPKKPDKIRVVFDCSPKFAGISLNDQLLQGPDLPNSLVGVLTRFRKEPVAFMADIEAMFYQVFVPEEQQDFLHLLWWPNRDLTAQLECRMTVHPFGAVSSPSCSNYTLWKPANNNEGEYGSAVERFAAPFTLKAKKLLQDLCKDEKLGWDNELRESYPNCWENWRSELPMLERILVPRCVKPIDFGEVKSRQVHIFSDASSVGYGSVAYLRLCDHEDHIHCSFLMAKLASRQSEQ
ncbi:uncharacterized protein [Montipora capricornis]|uniref:uncharacterized protein n=1 Tax=Montipora capricornis TaxID=246305 RepID=UPI0035F14B60